MIKTIFFIALLALSIFIGIQLQHDPGYVYISMNHYTIETTVWFALCLLLLTLGCIALITAIFLKIIHIPSRLKTWWIKKCAEKKHRLTYAERMVIEKQKQESRLLQLIEEKSTADIETCIARLPRMWRHDPVFITAYCQYLIDDNQKDKAEKILKTELKRNYQDAYIHLYGKIFVNQTQLNFAESFLKKHNNSAELMLTLGRLCIQHHLWGKAIHYLEQSIQLNPMQEAHAELGNLYERLNREDQACDMYKRGLLLST